MTKSVVQIIAVFVLATGVGLAPILAASKAPKQPEMENHSSMNHDSMNHGLVENNPGSQSNLLPKEPGRVHLRQLLKLL